MNSLNQEVIKTQITNNKYLRQKFQCLKNNLKVALHSNFSNNNLEIQKCKIYQEQHMFKHLMINQLDLN